MATPRHAEALQRFAQRVHVRAAFPAIEQILDEIEHRLVVGVRARKAQRLVQRAELLAAATARAPAGAQEPLAPGRGVGPEGLAQRGQPPDGARALGNTACLAHARFTLCGGCGAFIMRWKLLRSMPARRAALDNVVLCALEQAEHVARRDEAR